MRRIMLILALGTLGMSACGGNDAGREPLAVSELREIETQFESAARAQIEAWNTHDIEQIRSIYTDDAVHLDGTVRLEGLDLIVAMAEQMDTTFPDMEGRLGGLFAGRDDALGIWEVFGLLTWTSENPIIEYDLLEIRDQKISSWRLYYDPDTRPFFTRSAEHDDLAAQILDEYTAAWSSGDADAVAGLYDPAGVREDTLFEERSEGTDAIAGYATDWFGWYPGGTFELLAPIAERTRTDPVIGGVMAFRDHEGCEVRMAVLLDSSGSRIVRERIYYDVDSLVSCGWAS